MSNSNTDLGFAAVKHAPIRTFIQSSGPLYKLTASRSAGGRMCLTRDTGLTFRTSRVGETFAEFLDRTSNGFEKGLCVRIFGIWADRIVLVGTGVDKERFLRERAKSAAAE